MIYDQGFKDLGILPDFTQLKIKDSTSFQLPENMAEKYTGSGGSGSGASIRIQFEYDFKTGAISDLSLHAFNNQDLNDAVRTISSVQTGELVLRDLGYSKIEIFQQIISQEAFFLSRLKNNITVYEKKGNDLVKIDFQGIEAKMKETGQTFIENQVYIGDREKLPVRLLIELMPEDKKQERLRTAQQTAKKKGRKIGKDYMARYGLNLFITNIDEQKMDGRKLRKLYLIRWQIELMFKTWKSIGEIHLVKKMKVERFETFLYAKLLYIVINWKIFWQMQIRAMRIDSLLLSAFKVFSTLKNRLYDFRLAITKGQAELEIFIRNIMNTYLNKFRIEKKKDKLSLPELLKMIV